MTENTLVGQVVRNRRRKNFTMIQNAMAQDDQLSWNARGIMTYLLSLPDDWVIYKTEIIKHGDIGRDKFNKVWNELQSFGYLSKEKVKNLSDGTFQGVMWILNEEPEITRRPENPLFGENPVKSTEGLKIRPTDNPTVGKPEVRETRPLTNKHSLTNTHNKQIEEDDEVKREETDSKSHPFEKSLQKVAKSEFGSIFDTLAASLNDQEDIEAIKQELNQELVALTPQVIRSNFEAAWEFTQSRCESDAYFGKYLLKNLQMKASKSQRDKVKRSSEQTVSETITDDFFASVDALRKDWGYAN